jgi:ferredoxin-fold anticodon binding domain-containing protein
MNSVLQELVGKKVSVHSAHAAVADIGVLESFDQQWVRLRKSDTDILYFGIAQIRLIKPFLS